MSVSLFGMKINAEEEGEDVTELSEATEETSGTDTDMEYLSDDVFEYTKNGSEAEITGYTGTEKDISIPSRISGHTVTSIGSGAFMNSTVTSVVIPNTVTSIGDQAFYGCTSLGKIDLNNNLKSVGLSAFKNCPDTMETTFYGSQKQFNQIAIESNNEPLSNHLFCKWPESLMIEEGTSAVYPVGRTAALTLIVKPSYAFESVKWSSNNTGVVTVDENGKITVKAKGTAKVTVTSSYDPEATASITIKAIVPGWEKVNGKWKYMNTDGNYTKNGWQKISGKWYYLESSGAMAVGWKKISGVWYYLNSSGAMVTGWHKISGTWYYFKGSGAMVTGTFVIDGKTYRFSSSGAWIK